MPKYKVSLTERITQDWMVEIEAETEAEAEALALMHCDTLGTSTAYGTDSVEVDWVEEIS